MLDIGETGVQKEKTEEEMRALYETSMKSLQNGNILKGKIININGDTVIVDVGLKSEGKVSTSEFTSKTGELKAQVGDEVEVMIVGREREFGLLLLSKQKVDFIRTWQKINQSFEDGTYVDGDIVSEVKGGFSVDIGVNAFLPISQVDIKPVKNASSFVGRHLRFKIIKVNQRKGNVIVSRRIFLEEEKEKKKSEFWKNTKKDQVLYGFVRNITDYGAFIDLGGVDGFLYLNEITWGRITHPKEYLRVGDEVKVKVLEIDPENQKVSVSIKQLKPDPWLKVNEKYPIGEKVKGKVVGIIDYGVFVELEQGVEGLLHISEMSWDRKIKNPGKIVKKGEWLELVILGIDNEKKRISLGLKQLMPDPWDELAREYPVGSVIKGKVKNITDFGMFVGIGNGIDGLVHMSEVSWSRRKKSVTDTYKKGSMVDALVINIDKGQKKFSLSIKQLNEDPWSDITEHYHVGDIVEGYITSLTDFGIFIEIENGIEGLIHISEVDEAKGKHPSELFNIDDKVRAMVLNIDARNKRIGLSMKAIRKVEEDKTIETYTRDEGALSTLGDFFERSAKRNDAENT
ncbi:MAG TPA: 30S ribosomal protein S1 [Syntrophorhabdaceae bacterium]|jgi:small subunit ribosomal protein S1|nr:30S ribosomal protein S1 [Syntrophorhabdaceae bacterium]MDI9561207.1 30S ribosomal protein S1 [Pseudomonadota bacterium]OQC49683.1 MAG: 30S ribosomal protein S1 [Deltaproteobacteria bacterium ADurb.Bin026]MBP8697471.1 30S ribosomal protein S1 [Syntrophorhabdaceae bacterium]MBV6504847.1 30S ribosomal protein S1 [Syntrophorhabdaceae bacterium]